MPDPFVVPGLKAAGWAKGQIREQYRITNGKIIASSRRHRSGNPLIADYVLEYRDDLPLAVVEAKRTKVDAAAGIEQAKRYAQRLELPVAYATNGREIWEIEIGGAIRKRPTFPSPEELWTRFCASEGVNSPLEKEMLLAPFDSSLRDYNLERKRLRYYQRIAVNRALRAIARGEDRILLAGVPFPLYSAPRPCGAATRRPWPTRPHTVMIRAQYVTVRWSSRMTGNQLDAGDGQDRGSRGRTR